MRFYMKRYLTIHLIFHDQHVPEIMKSMKMHELANYKHCKLDPAFQNTSWTQSYWRRRKLNYPRNLLRNVARINIFTYYVLSIDIHMLPTPDFPKKFLKFIRNHDTWRFADIPEPYTSVFCLPVFPIHLWDFVPKDKLQLRKLQVTRLSRRQKRWLDAPNPHDEVFIYEISKETDFCVVYVSINELEPLYDEQDENGSILEEDTSLKCQFLVDLKYNFIVLDGVFLIEHILWRKWTILNSRRRKKRALKSIRRRYIWHRFYTKVISLVPDEFAQLWNTRLRSSWQRRLRDG